MSTTDSIRQLIHIVRGVSVMLDADLAAIYGYTTKAFNQQVRNNIAKFDDDFRFQLTKEEYDKILRSKILTSEENVISLKSKDNGNEAFLRSNFLTSKTENRGGRQYLPYAFTEQGIYMLMTVLKGDLATQQSKMLIRTFKEMKDFIVDNKSLIGTKEKEFDDFTKQYPNLTIRFRKTSGIYHDRYIIVDYGTKNEHIYHCGASSKDAGNKVTTIAEVSDRQVYHSIVDALLQTPDLQLPN